MALIIQDQNGATYQLSVNASDDSLVLQPAPNNTPSPGGANSITTTALQIIEDALMEIGALAPGEAPANEDLSFGLRKLQRLIDRYNARLPNVYNVNFSRFTIPVNQQPITIGPGADFDVSQRPVDIPTASLILVGTGNTEVEVPLNIRDQQWWAAQTIKNLTSTLPTDLYYSPDWPNGSIYLWPIPTAVNDIRIQSRLVLGEFTKYTNPFTLPPGYWDAIVYPLAISLCPAFNRTAGPDLLRLSEEAMKAMQGNNISSPRMFSDSPSQGSASSARPSFNFLTGLNRSR